MTPNDANLTSAGKNSYTISSTHVTDTLADSLICRIAILNKDGIIQTSNEAWKSFDEESIGSKLSSDGLKKINYLEACRKSGSPFFVHATLAFDGIVSVLNGNKQSFLLEYQCTSNADKWFAMNVTALPGMSGAVVSHTDITERKTIEKMNEEFFSITSHELKTPITSLKGIAHILKLSFGEKISREGAKLLGTMDIQLNKLTKIIEDLLVVNTRQERSFNLSQTEFNFQKLVKETVENVANISQLHFLIIKENERILYNGDRLRLEQVITNLLTNAVKYSPQSNQIIINSIVRDNNILLSIQDFGLGIKKENSKKIFEKFYRADNANIFSGLGLGLYISSEIIKAHNGDMWVESEVDKGSTFYFSLPLNKK